MDDSQILIPRSFIDLYIPVGAARPRLPRADISALYELCEDLAQSLTETANDKRFELGVDETTVLERVHAGLLTAPATVSADEATWVVRRLAELLDWPLPAALALPAPDPGRDRRRP